MTPARYAFDRACEGLLQAVIKAALHDPRDPWTYLPYYGEVDGRAIWQAKYVMRQAERLGLWSREDLLDVLVRLDVEAGELV